MLTKISSSLEIIATHLGKKTEDYPEPTSELWDIQIEKMLKSLKEKFSTLQFKPKGHGEHQEIEVFKQNKKIATINAEDVPDEKYDYFRSLEITFLDDKGKPIPQKSTELAGPYPGISIPNTPAGWEKLKNLFKKYHPDVSKEAKVQKGDIRNTVLRQIKQLETTQKLLNQGRAIKDDEIDEYRTKKPAKSRILKKQVHIITQGLKHIMQAIGELDKYKKTSVH